jgi:dynein heavy chain
MIIFVDDLNMPKKEEYGAQPPIEILRQFLDYKGWYNRKELTLRNFEDMVMFCAMGPPGGGKSIITSRMVRHFNLLAYTELDDGSIKSIFNSLMKYFFRNFQDGLKVIKPTFYLIFRKSSLL